MVKTRRNLERIKKKRQEPAFYSRPQIEPEKREELFDKIRKHLDSLPVFISYKNLNNRSLIIYIHLSHIQEAKKI